MQKEIMDYFVEQMEELFCGKWNEADASVDWNNAEITLEAVARKLMKVGEPEAIKAYAKIAFYRPSLLFRPEEVMSEVWYHGMLAVLMDALEEADEPPERKLAAKSKALLTLLNFHGHGSYERDLAVWENDCLVNSNGDLLCCRFQGHHLLLPKTVKTLHKAVFSPETVDLVQKVTLPGGLRSGMASYLNRLENLETVHLADAAGEYATVDGVLYDRKQTTLLHYPRGRHEHYEVPAGTKVIGMDAFSGSSVTDVVLPHGLELLDEAAFSSCRGLRMLSIPATVKEVRFEAFAYCDNLTCVIVENGETVFGEDVFYDADVVTLSAPARSLVEAYANEEGIPFVGLEEVHE